MAARVRGIKNGTHEDFDFENPWIMGDLVNRSSFSRLPSGCSLGKLCWVGIAGDNRSLQGGRIFTRDNSPPFGFPCPITWKTKQIALGVFHPLLVPAHI